MRDNLQLEFFGFEPEADIRNLIAVAGERLQSDAPSDSLLKMAFKGGVGAVQASCQIVSQAGTFVADAVSETPLLALRKIEFRIRRQLERWKKIRFIEGR